MIGTTIRLQAPPGGSGSGPLPARRAGGDRVRAYRVTVGGRRVDAGAVEWIELPAWILEGVAP